MLLGALPSAQHVPLLHAEGVRAVVNTCDEYPGPTSAYAAHAITQLHVRTVDYTAPSMAHIEQAVEYMLAAAQRRQRVYGRVPLCVCVPRALTRVPVHCKAGRGRSATVVICYLMRRHGMLARDAQLLLLRVRPHVSRHLYRRAVVLAYERKLAQPQAPVL